jgi:hypothetical protein
VNRGRRGESRKKKEASAAIIISAPVKPMHELADVDQELARVGFEYSR